MVAEQTHIAHQCYGAATTIERRFDVVALGEAMVEFNQTDAGQPHYLQGFGGDTSNAVIAAARAGARSAYLTRVGDDAFGQALLQLWAREGVDASAVEVARAEPTGIYFVTHAHSGHAFSYRRAGSAASRMTPHWLHAGPAADAVRSARILHLSGITLALSPEACDTAFAAMHLARASATLVSFDANLRPQLWPLDAARSAIERAVALSDIFLPSLDDMQALCGLDDENRIIDWGHARGAAAVVLKLGALGALVSDGSSRLRLEGHRVELRDGTGAGDCFCGNLLARMVQGDSIFQAAGYANAAAALAVQGFGAVAPLPRPPAVRALL